MYAIKDFQCEPHHQHQNHVEQCIQEAKKLSNCSGSPPSLWLLCVQHVLYIINCLSTKGHQWKTPLEVATGQQLDFVGMNPFTSNTIPLPVLHLHTPPNLKNN
jgi:hypothetical protein